MVKTVASVQREISELRKEREAIYNEILRDLDQKIATNQQWIKNNCGHNEDNLIINEICEEDEYGKRCPSWDKLVVECSVCGKVVTVNKEKFKARDYGLDEVMNLLGSDLEKLQ